MTGVLYITHHWRGFGEIGRSALIVKEATFHTKALLCFKEKGFCGAKII
jgi:hypothetical protein